MVLTNCLAWLPSKPQGTTCLGPLVLGSQVCDAMPSIFLDGFWGSELKFPSNCAISPDSSKVIFKPPDLPAFVIAVLRNEHKTYSLVGAPEPSDCKVSVAADQEQDKEKPETETGEERQVKRRWLTPASRLVSSLQCQLPLRVTLPPRSEAHGHKVKGT